MLEKYTGLGNQQPSLQNGGRFNDHPKGVGLSESEARSRLTMPLKLEKLLLHRRSLSMWTPKYESCISCRTTRLRHMAKGLCSGCYAKQYQADPTRQAKMREQKHTHYIKKGGVVWAKQHREAFWFDSMREPALDRDGHKCTRCGSTEKLVVHHKDHDGRGAKASNNSLENLETLCRSCHARHHSSNEGWSKHHASCLSCGTTERKHNAKGLCWSCYMKKRYTAASE